MYYKECIASISIYILSRTQLTREMLIYIQYYNCYCYFLTKLNISIQQL